LDEIEQKLNTQRKEQKIQFSIPRIDRVRSQTACESALEEAHKTYKKPKSQDKSIYSEKARLINLPAPDQFTVTLSPFVAAYAANVNSENIQIAEIEHLVSLMPIPSTLTPYWSQIPPTHLSEALTILDTTLMTYFKALRAVDRKGVSAKECNIVYALYAIIHSLALAQDRIVQPDKDASHSASLAHYPLYFHGLNTDRDSFLMYVSPEDYQRRQVVIAYFRGTFTEDQTSSPLFQLDREYVYDALDVDREHDVVTYLFALANDHRFADWLKIEKWRMDRGYNMFFLIPDAVKKAGLAAQLAKSLQRERQSDGREGEDAADLLSQRGFGHVPILFQAACIARSVSVQTHSAIPHMEVTVEGSGEFLGAPQKYTFGLGNILRDHSYKVESTRLHPSLKKRQKDLLEQQWNNRKKYVETLSDEAYVLRDVHPKKEEIIDPAAFVRAGCEPQLLPSKLVAYYRSRLDLFQNFSEQIVFEIAFFRSFILDPVKEDDIYHTTNRINNPYDHLRSFPLAEEMAQKSFRDQVTLLIQEGIDRYLLRQPHQKPQVLAATCFIRLACRLTRFNPNFNFDALGLVERMLGTSGPTQEERSLLNLHLVLVYSTLGRKPSEKEVEAIFGAWVYYKNTPIPDWSHPLLEREVESFVHQTSHLLRLDNNFQITILTSALKQLGIQLPSSYKITVNESQIVRACEEDGKYFWEVNLLTGEARSENGILRCTGAPSGLKDETFISLFGNKFAPSYFETEGCYYFSHPRLGMFRALQIGKRHPATFVIQKEIDGQWYQYVHPSSLRALPQFLGTYYTHWVAPSRQHLCLLILHPKTGRRVATLLRDGTIKSPEDHCYVKGPEGTFLDTFEMPQYIHWDQTKKETTLHFWRYQSQAHTPLIFTLENGQLTYNANRKYVLSQTQQPSLLGATGGSLLLTHRDDTSDNKLLVAMHPLQGGALPLITSHALSIDPSGTYSSEYTKSQKNKFEYLEFDIKQGTLHPLTLEGTIYLSYQAIAERKYEKALYWLKQIDFREPIRPGGITYLNQIVGWAVDQDASVEACALALHAWVLLKRRSERLQSEGRKKDDAPRFPMKAQEIYSRFEHQIPTSLLLNQAERHLCGLEERSDKLFFYCPEIRAHLPFAALERGQLHIEIPQIPTEIVNFFDNPEAHTLHMLDWQKTRCLEAAHKAVFTHTSFIPEEPLPPSSSENFFSEDFLFTDSWTQEFQQRFFSTAYEVARGNRGTNQQRQRLAFQLHVAYETQKPLPQCLPYLQFAIDYPKEALDLPAAQDYPARFRFVKDYLALTRSKPCLKEHGPEERSVEYTGGLVRKFFASSSPPRVAESCQMPLELAPFSMTHIDGGVTRRLATTYLQLKPLPTESSVEVESLKFPVKEQLNSEEQEFFLAIASAFEAFDKEMRAGAKINEQRRFYALKKSQDEALKEELEHEIKQLEGQRVQLEATLLELFNKHDPDVKKTTLFKEAKIEKERSLKNLAELFLMGDADKFAQANGYLRNPKLLQEFANKLKVAAYPNLLIDYLYNLMGLYMILSVQQNRFTRAVELCKKIIPLGDKELQRDALVQKLSQELTSPQEPIYEIKKYPAFLVFEYLSGFSMRQNQANVLKKLLETNAFGRYVDRVSQLMMGEGKTAVIAVILLKLAAQKGRLSLFVTPASQHASVSYNLRKALRDCFGIDMEEIEVTREQLARSPTLCGEVLNRLKDTMASGNFLLIKAETLQALGLQFLDFVYQVSRSEKEDPEMMCKINELREILLLLKEQGDALIDEVDLVLNVLQEVNFPVGEMKRVSPERIEVVRSLFMILINSKATIEEGKTVDLENLVGLKENRQNLVTPQQWQETVAPAVAYNLLRTLPSLKLQGRPDLCKSFERYINGKMNPECQRVLDQEIVLDNTSTKEDRADYDFLVYVQQLWKSTDPTEHEAAHHIALVKHLMQDILPVTFGKQGNRNYGRGGTKPGEVRHYEAVGTPSENLFGNHWEAIAFHFQTVLLCGIDEAQFRHIAGIYQDLAERQASRDKMVFARTYPAIAFHALTTIHLHEVEEEGKVELALQNLKKNDDARLRFETDTAGEHVGYYPSRLNSTGQTLVSMPSTVRAMSGTPYNVHCYAKRLTTYFEAFLGAEGQIAHAILTRAAAIKGNKKYTHVIQTTEIKDFFKAILDTHPHKERVRLLMDSGALFKNYSNLEVAKAIRDYLGMPVLFFMRNSDKNETTPDTLAVLKIGAEDPELIGGTKLENIQKTGLNVEDCFGFLDERHTTGTDIPWKDDIIGLMTVDENILLRALYQTVLRERGFFLSQEVEYVIPSYLISLLDAAFPMKHIQNRELRLLAQITSLAIKNQAIALAKQVERSYKHKIAEVFKQQFVDQLVTSHPILFRVIKKIFPDYEQSIIITQADLIYNHSGAVVRKIDTDVSLKNYQRLKHGQFPETNWHDKSAIEEQTNLVVVESKKSPHLTPARVSTSTSTDLGTQVSVLTEVAQEVDQETDQEVEQEILQELQRYQKADTGKVRPEQVWQEAEITTLINQAAAGALTLHTLDYAMCRDHYYYYEDYSLVFSKAIHMTKSWLMATEKTLPVFHRMQRPLDHLLIVQKAGGGYAAIVLAQHEANQFKTYLKLHQGGSPLVWLIQSDGSSSQDTSVPFPFDRAIRAILVECNVFNGRIDALEADQEQAKGWLNANPKSIEIKKSFLKIKIAQNQTQKNLFFRSEIFGDAATRAQLTRYRWMIDQEKAATLGEKEIQGFTEEDTHKFKWLNEKQLNWILPGQVSLLGDLVSHLSKPALIAAIPNKNAAQMQPCQMQHIAAEQVPWFEQSVTKTQAIPADLCSFMTDAQMQNISPMQVSEIRDVKQLERLVHLNPQLLAHVGPGQASLVSSLIAPHLRNRKTIEAISPELQAHLHVSLRPSSSSIGRVSSSSPTVHQIQVQTMTAPLPLPKVEEGAKGSSRAWVITKVVLIVIGVLVTLGVVVTGAFALMGAFWPQAPQFTLLIYHALQHPLVIPCASAGACMLLLVGLVAFAVHQCRKDRPHVKNVII
jgi:hypothetical protein